ncbi:MAG: GPR endopeptidase [Clostridia bacterium]|nr:GPR endopeptidase [Clostridia bacterium]
MPKNIFCRTDLAAEWREEQTELPQGVRYSEQQLGKSRVLTLVIESPQGAALAGRAMGCYQTVELGGCLHFSESEKEECAALLCSLIIQAERALCPKKEDAGGCVLVAGLGNRAMTADAVGPLTVERVMVTNHVKQLDPSLFKSLHHRAVAAVCPGVLGQTGIESALIVKQMVGALHPRLLLVVDALAARSSARLCSTVQLSTGGIAPGSGVGNDRPAFTKESMGVPVLALGVPTVVDSSTLVADALEQAGIGDPPPALRSVLEGGKSFFVSPKEVDGAVEVLAEILAKAIDGAMDLGGDRS